ncbi:MAG: hypothetical protein GY720_23340 [bacterium]|nr:hypothetical protein [bacterium]
MVTLPEFADLATDAELIVVDPSEWDRRVPKAQVALVLLTVAARRAGVIPIDAVSAAAAGPFESANYNAIEAGVALA